MGVSNAMSSKGMWAHGMTPVYFSTVCSRTRFLAPSERGRGWWRAIMMTRPIHPGEILADELTELEITQTEFARQIKVPANRVSQIIHGKRAITGDTALRLGHWFGMSPQFWLNLQAACDVDVARRRLGADLARLPRRSQAA